MGNKKSNDGLLEFFLTVTLVDCLERGGLHVTYSNKFGTATNSIFSL